MLKTLPAAARDCLRKAQYHTAAQNALLFNELGRLLAALSQKRIPTLVLKGPALAKLLYPEPALRPMNDLDLVVHREHLAESVEIAMLLGYVVEQPEHLGVAGWMDQALNHHVFLRGGPEQRLALEIHWNLLAGNADARTPSMEWFWEHAQPWEGLSHRPQEGVYALSPTAYLLYLPAHLVLQHGAMSLPSSWFYELHLLVGRCGGEIDWDGLIGEARLLHWSNTLLAVLVFLQDTFHTPIPPTVLQQLEHDADPAGQRLLDDTTPTGSRSIDTWHSLQSVDAPLRWRWVIALLFPRPQYIRYRYQAQIKPGWTWPFFYLYRWFDIGRDGLATLVKSIQVRMNS
jgi:hypothetical protein